MRHHRQVPALFPALVVAVLVASVLGLVPATADADPPAPSIVVNINPDLGGGHQVVGVDWPEGETVELRVDDPATPTIDPDFSDLAATDAGVPSFVFELGDVVLAPGHEVEVVVVGDPSTSDSTTVTPLSLDSVDLTSDVVSGTAVAGETVTVWLERYDALGGGQIELPATANGSGVWSADFSSVVDLEEGQVGVRSGTSSTIYAPVFATWASASPTSGLVDGQAVHVQGAASISIVMVVQCGPGATAEDCVTLAGPLPPTDDPFFETTVDVGAQIHPASGTVDCTTDECDLVVGQFNGFELELLVQTPLSFDRPPVITDIDPQVVDADTTSAPISFVVADDEQPPGDLVVTATSADQTLVPDENLALGGYGYWRLVRVTPAAGQTGTTEIEVAVSDGLGQQATTTFQVMVVPSGAVVVDTTADRVDTAAGDGRCETAAGTCSLRAAIQETNARPGQDEIVLPDPVAHPLTVDGSNEDAGATGDLDVTDDLVISGFAGTTVSAAGLGDRVLDVRPGATAEVRGLTLAAGGGVDAGGGVRAAAGTDLTLDHVRVTDSFSLIEGGGVRSEGDALALVESVVSDNASFGAGGGISTDADLTLHRTTVSDNIAGYGGGLLTRAADLTMTSSNLDRNRGVVAGGGAALFGDTTIDSSTMQLNTAGVGAGMFAAWGTMVFTNTTFAYNVADDHSGGLLATTPSLTLDSVTFGSNDAQSADSLGLDHLGNYNPFFASVPSAHVTLRNSILDTGEPATSECADRATSTLLSAGHNIVSDGSCGLGGPGDQESTPSFIMQLMEVPGSYTPVMVPFELSPAIDAGDTALTIDQLGQPRPAGAADDVGAVEIQPG